MKLRSRDAVALINSLGAGVVPRTGLRHIAVGRLREVEAIKYDLDHIREGGGTIRFVIGRFGSGKSFLIQLARAYALEQKFVVADADFTAERRLYGSSGQAVATYRELIRNLSTNTRPDGNALPAIIERWISTIQTKVMTEQHLAIDSAEFTQAMKQTILQTLNDMEELVHGFDFAQVISLYYEGYLTDNDELKSNAIRWLRGEFSTKTEARHALGVRTIISDDNYYDYLKVLARFVRDIGYNGLLICLDEAVNLYKLTNSIARTSNYEQLLSIFNDMLQGRASSIGFLIGGTPEFLEDQRRGLYSYEALRSRLVSSRFETNDMKDYSGPVLSLTNLANEEIFVLLQKIRDLHSEYAGGNTDVDDQAIISFMQDSLNRTGASEFLTPRDMIREFVHLLNMLKQYPDKQWQDLLPVVQAQLQTTNATETVHDEEDDPLARFTHFRVG